MKVNHTSWLIPLFLCGSLLAEPKPAATAKKRGEPAKRPAAAVEAPPAAPEGPAGKIVHYGEKDVIQLNTKVRYTTMIILPSNEKILDFACGDKEFWVINGAQNFCYVKPAKPATQTNLNLITASGNIYSFVLSEISETPGVEPDLKIFVEPKEQSMIGAADRAPRFVPAHDVEELQRRIEELKEDLRRQRRATDEAIDRGIQKFIASLRFSYHFQADKKPFSVQAIYHSEKFTYIAAHPSETPTLYEIRDGQPNLIHFEFQNGVFMVPKILDKGYLAIGKHKFEFKREE
jgi:type IV secretory pathway VirB9-like protein